MANHQAQTNLGGDFVGMLRRHASMRNGCMFRIEIYITDFLLLTCKTRLTLKEEVFFVNLLTDFLILKLRI